MNSLDALRCMVVNYPGGHAALAARLGKFDEMLRKELSCASTGHKMCLEAGNPEAHALGTVFSFKAGLLSLPVMDMGVDGLCRSRTKAHSPMCCWP